MVRSSVERTPSGRRLFLILAAFAIIPLLCSPYAKTGFLVRGEDADEATAEANEFWYNPQEFASSYEALRSDLAAPSSSGGDEGDDATCASPSANNLVVAAVQMSSSGAVDARAFLDRALEAVKTAATEHNATLVLLQELFLGPYFCQSQEAVLFGLAEDLGPVDDDDCGANGGNPVLERMRDAAREHSVVLPVSIFERRNNVHYNTVVMIDSDGSILGRYRKSHIPDGTGYQEKFYFSPGDTGFQVFRTRVGNVGVGICWDQWFPEAARAMSLKGADIILYPTAIGSEPQDPTLDSSDHWRRVMQGHAAANMVPVVASNRVGTEVLMTNDGSEKQRITFYGKSFITDETGAVIREVRNSGQTEIISAEINAEKNRRTRTAWGLFRDRRPELYNVLKTKDGQSALR